MQKVSFFRSIHVKLVLIYVLLILIAMQIIGLYFARELEDTLKTNFTTSIADRMKLVEFSVREEMLKERPRRRSVTRREFADRPFGVYFR